MLRLIINRESRPLLGAAAVGPHADAWIGEATLAIRARVPVDVLADVVRPFPTYSGGVHTRLAACARPTLFG